MKRLIILFALLPLLAFGGNGTWEKYINLLDIQTNTIYGVQEPSAAVQDTRPVSSLKGYLFLDYTRKEHSELAIPTDALYWHVWVKYRVVGNATQYELRIGYDQGASTYSDYAVIPITNSGYEIIVDRVEGEYYHPTLGWQQVSNAANSTKIPNDIDLRLELRSETVYAMDPGVVADQSRLSFNNTTFRVNWSFVQGAEAYDLEWVFIDKYSAEYTELTTHFNNPTALAANPDYAFDLKAGTRVRVWGTNYVLDKTYPEGTLYFRVRSVSNFTESGALTDQIKLGSWNSLYDPANYGGTIDANDIVRHEIIEANEFEAAKNWLYGVAFAEDGKSVSSITFYDGSNRGRQSSTYNTSDHVTLIGESFYDREGRQTISVVPAPVRGRQMGYRSNFNLDDLNDPLDEEDFDFESSTTPGPQLYSPTSGESGAAQYFSSNNQFTDDLFRSAIPNADGYVYSQTIYRNDGSGRVERIGGLGADFQASGTHAVLTYYGSPSEYELKRLFGSNVSNDPKGYRKEMVRDANGQYSVAYYDKRGHTIATAMTGEAPSNLLKIEQGTVETLTTDLTSNNIEINGTDLVAEFTFLNGVQNNNVTFSYSVTGLVNTLSAQTFNIGGEEISIGQLCGSCHYDLTFRVIKPDGTEYTVVGANPMPVEMNIDPGACQAANATFSRSLTFAEIGEYRIIKILSVDEDAMMDAFATYVETNIIDEATFVSNYVDQVDLTGCFDNCDDYCEALWIQDYMETNNVNKAAAQAQWDGLSSGAKASYLETCYADVCNPEEVTDDFTIPGEDPYNACSAYEDIAMDQLSPGGFIYDGPATNSFWVDLQARLSASNPPEFYENYTQDANGDYTGTGNQYTSLTDLRDPNKFREQWLPLFLPSHREYCHLQLCDESTNSNTYSIGLANLVNNTPWSTSSSVYTNPYNNDIYGWSDDPFISTPANASNQLQTKIASYLTDQYTIYSSTWGCPGVSWPTSGSMLDYIENYAACVVYANPSLTTAEIEQMKKAMFLGIYNQLKEEVFAAYKAAQGCDFYNDDYAIFHAPPTGDEMQAEIANIVSAAVNPPNCNNEAWNHTLQWLNQLPLDCQIDLGMKQYNSTTGGYVLTFDQTDLQTAYATGGAAINTLAEYFYAFSREVCSVNTWGWFYDPDTGSGTQPGEAEYDAIVTILSGTPCSLTQPYSFEVDPAPGQMTTSIVDQDLSDCFVLLVEVINDALANNPMSQGVNSTNYPEFSADCPNLAAGTLSISTSSNRYTITYMVGTTQQCSFKLYTMDGNYLLPSTGLVSLSNPYKQIIGSGMSAIEAIVFDALLSDGTIVQVYVDAKNELCTSFDVASFGTQTVQNIPDFPFDLNPVEDCIEAETLQAEADGHWLYDQMVNELYNQFHATTPHCLDVTETYTMSYDLKEYQYTLYYYDLAGNLVQTVPPQGVDVLTVAEVTNGDQPQHKMATRYQYNGLNSVITSFTPDGGRSELYLDKLYRVRFSQNAQQVLDGKAAYSRYDELGRVVEAGEFKIPSGHNLVDKTEIVDYPTSGVLDYTHTFYEGIYEQPQASQPYYPIGVSGSNDASIATQFGNAGQENLRNAIGAVMHRQADYDANGNLVAGTEVITVLSYSYDPHKNVKSLVSTNYQLQGISQQHKTVNYNYDLISGNVEEVAYQAGKAEEFRHRYHYDANNRLIRAFTSNNNVIWEMDAKYFYYLHGALARTETGHDKVQGTDYAYNLLGWLKGVNSATLDLSRDLGFDARDGALNKWSGVDAFGFQLGYYDGDYESIGSVGAFAGTDGFTQYNQNPESSNAPMDSHYSGNISHMVTAMRDINEATIDILGNNYKYDQLQRIREMKVYSAANLQTNNDFTGATLYRELNGESAFQESYTFDRNGNLLTLKRNGSGMNSYGSLYHNIVGQQPFRVPLEMDNFAYSYYNDYPNTVTVSPPVNYNRLARVADSQLDDDPSTLTTIEGSQYEGDIFEGDHDYTYNAIGQLITDLGEEIQTIEWTVTGKVKKITFTTAGHNANKNDVKFIYDPMDMRVAKMVYDDATTNVNITYYSYDASGNVMATYDRTITRTSVNATKRNYTDTYKTEELQVYGAKRLGVQLGSGTIVAATITQTISGNSDVIERMQGFSWSETNPMAFDNTKRVVNDRYYEMANHLGNVLVVVSDRKIEYNNLDYYTADVVSYSDYSPYGTLLDGRHGEQNGSDYRYGFQGQEADDEIKGEGNSYNYTFRMSDPRIGRFFAIDPLSPQYPWYTPYQFAGNKVIQCIELEGLEEAPINPTNLPEGCTQISSYAAVRNDPDAEVEVIETYSVYQLITTSDVTEDERTFAKDYMDDHLKDRSLWATGYTVLPETGTVGKVTRTHYYTVITQTTITYKKGDKQKLGIFFKIASSKTTSSIVYTGYSVSASGTFEYTKSGTNKTYSEQWSMTDKFHSQTVKSSIAENIYYFNKVPNAKVQSTNFTTWRHDKLLKAAGEYHCISGASITMYPDMESLNEAINEAYNAGYEDGVRDAKRSNTNAGAFLGIVSFLLMGPASLPGALTITTTAANVSNAVGIISLFVGGENSVGQPDPSSSKEVKNAKEKVQAVINATTNWGTRYYQLKR